MHSHVQWLVGQALLPSLGGKLVLLHLQRDDKVLDTCVAFRVAGTSGFPDKLSLEDSSFSHPTTDYLSIVMYSSLIMLVYILAIMACVWVRGRKGEKFKKEQSQKKSLKIIKKIKGRKVDVKKFSVVDKFDKIRQQTQTLKSKEKVKKSNSIQEPQLWKTFLEAVDHDHDQYRKQLNFPCQLNSLSSHNHLVSLDSRLSGIHQHNYSDDSIDDDGDVVNMADTDDSVTESEDCEVVDNTVKLEYESEDFVRGICEEAFSKLPNITTVVDMESLVPDIVIKVPDKPGVENIKIERLMNLHNGQSENEDILKTGFNIPTHDKNGDVNIYDEVSVSHKSIKVQSIAKIAEDEDYDVIGCNSDLQSKLVHHKTASLIYPKFHFTRDRKYSYTIHNRPLPPIPPPTQSSVSLP